MRKYKQKKKLLKKKGRQTNRKFFQKTENETAKYKNNKGKEKELW